MTERIAFYIWLQELEVEYAVDGDNYALAQIGEIKEKYADMFNVNDEINSVMEKHKK